jgi:hypothetical protein
VRVASTGLENSTSKPSPSALKMRWRGARQDAIGHDQEPMGESHLAALNADDVSLA